MILLIRRKALLGYSFSIWFPAPLWLLLNYLHFSFLQKISKEKHGLYGRGGNENFQFKFQSDRLSSPALSVSDQATWATGRPNIELRLDRIFIQMDNICKFHPIVAKSAQNSKTGKMLQWTLIKFESSFHVSPVFIPREWMIQSEIRNKLFHIFLNNKLVLISLPSYRHQSQSHNKYC